MSKEIKGRINRLAAIIKSKIDEDDENTDLLGSFFTEIGIVISESNSAALHELLDVLEKAASSLSGVNLREVFGCLAIAIVATPESERITGYYTLLAQLLNKTRDKDYDVSRFYSQLEAFSDIIQASPKETMTAEFYSLLGEIVDAVKAVPYGTDEDENDDVNYVKEALNTIAKIILITQEDKHYLDTQISGWQSLAVSLGQESKILDEAVHKDKAEMQAEIATLEKRAAMLAKRGPQAIVQTIHEIMTVDRGEYRGNSVGFEAEFLASDADKDSEDRELRPKPFLDIDSTYRALLLLQKLQNYGGGLATLHPNFGLTEKQLKNCIRADTYTKNFITNNCDDKDELVLLETYASIITKISYLCNSAARNLWKCYDQRYNFFIKTNITNCALGEFSPQVARLECKNFCLASDADLPMIRLFILAMWQALDNPKRARRLDRTLNAIFEHAGITMEKPSYTDDVFSESFTLEQALYGVDFGMPRAYEAVAGRQVHARRAVKEYLGNFINEGERINQEHEEESRSWMRILRQWIKKVPDVKKYPPELPVEAETHYPPENPYASSEKSPSGLTAEERKFCENVLGERLTKKEETTCADAIKKWIPNRNALRAPRWSSAKEENAGQAQR